ncbi:hypothetical protein C8R46DRAFT_1313311 [Mycena filopes]|nr:hypothetical protein C8R46DRAFT_1313311 [Mycena filopes]
MYVTCVTVKLATSHVFLKAFPMPPSIRSIVDFWRYKLTSTPRPMSHHTDTSVFAVFPPPDQRWTTVPAWINHLHVLPEADRYLVHSLQLYKDPNGVGHEWLRFTLTKGEDVVATIKTDRCSGVDGGSSVELNSSPSLELANANDRIVHATDPEGRDLLKKYPHLIMEATFISSPPPTVLHVAAVLHAVHNFSPKYDAVTASCFLYALTAFVLITDRFHATSESFRKQGYAANLVDTQRWAAILSALKIVDHVPPEQNLPGLRTAYESALDGIKAAITATANDHNQVTVLRDALAAERDARAAEHLVHANDRAQLIQLRTKLHQLGMLHSSEAE